MDLQENTGTQYTDDTESKLEIPQVSAPVEMKDLSAKETIQETSETIDFLINHGAKYEDVLSHIDEKSRNNVYAMLSSDAYFDKWMACLFIVGYNFQDERSTQVLLSFLNSTMDYSVVPRGYDTVVISNKKFAVKWLGLMRTNSSVKILRELTTSVGAEKKTRMWINDLPSRFGGKDDILEQIMVNAHSGLVLSQDQEYSEWITARYAEIDGYCEAHKDELLDSTQRYKVPNYTEFKKELRILHSAIIIHDYLENHTVEEYLAQSSSGKLRDYVIAQGMERNWFFRNNIFN